MKAIGITDSYLVKEIGFVGAYDELRQIDDKLKAEKKLIDLLNPVS